MYYIFHISGITSQGLTGRAYKYYNNVNRSCTVLLFKGYILSIWGTPDAV